jgi:hypothetical protein
LRTLWFINRSGTICFLIKVEEEIEYRIGPRNYREQIYKATSDRNCTAPGLYLIRSIFCFAVPKIEIVGESELYVKAGSTVSIRCVITRSLEEPAYIFWYRDSERVLNYDKSVIDIRMERVGADTTVSYN